jgi:hypothetical protein
MHINDLSQKAAMEIWWRKNQFRQDEYHRIIVAAATHLCSRGKTAWEYKTMWASGTTLWRREGHDDITVSVEELKSVGRLTDL